MINAADFLKWLNVFNISSGSGAASGTVNTGNINEVAYYDANGNAVSGLSTANNGVLVTSGTGVPSISQTIPTDTQLNITNVGTISDGVWNGTDIAIADGGTGVSTLPAGLLAGDGVNPIAGRTLAQPAAGITIADASGVAGNPTFALANDLAAVEGLTGTGIAVRSALDTWVQRSVAGTAGRISIANGDGVAANPTIDIDAAYVGQASITTVGTIATGTWEGTDVGVAHGGTGASTAATARTNLGINLNSSRSYSLIALAFNTNRTPSTTQDTLVIASVQMALDDGEDSTITFQIDDGGGFDSICSVRAQFDPTGVGVSGTAASRQTMTVMVPANSIYKIIQAGTGVNTIESINELTM